MANPWFRLYAEFADDPKVLTMPEVFQLRLVKLMCLRCKDETLDETFQAFQWRISSDEMAETKKLFLARGFIDEDWNLLNWNRRQFISDSSTERVRQYRQRMKRSETLHPDKTFEEIMRDETGGNVTKIERNVSVTPPEQIQSRTEADSEQRQSIRALAKTEAHSLSQAVNQEAHEDLTEWVELIAVAHPKGRLKNLSRREVPVGDRAAIIDAIILEAAKQGVSTAEAGKQLLAIVESLAETVPRAEWQYIKAIPYYFAEFEYRRDPETFKRSTRARGGSRNGNGHAETERDDKNAAAFRELFSGESEDGHERVDPLPGGVVQPEADGCGEVRVHGGAGSVGGLGADSGVLAGAGGMQILPKPQYPPRVQWPRRNG